jgi:GT2 family glycosyltransferase
MDLSIIVVNYNSALKTLSLLESIFNADMEGINFEILVIDNNSQENIASILKQKYPEIIFISSFKNRGMGGGNNIGINRAQGEFCFILNPDTLVEKDTIKIMVNYIRRNKEVAVLGPKLLNPDRSLQYSCARFPKFYTPIIRRTFLAKVFKNHINWFLMKDFDHKETKEVDWLMGSCLMIRKSSALKFDERYFMYFEDIDLCRSAWRSNYKVIYNPEARLIHDHQRESAQGAWYLAFFTNKVAREHIKSWLRYFYKWNKIKIKN